jgi:hypothetical protein
LDQREIHTKLVAPKIKLSARERDERRDSFGARPSTEIFGAPAQEKGGANSFSRVSRLPSRPVIRAHFVGSQRRTSRTPIPLRHLRLDSDRKPSVC